MFSPKLYTVRKIPLSLIISRNYNVSLSEDEEAYYSIKQGDNMLFRQIRMITCDDSDFNKFVVFVDCAGGQNKPDAMRHIIEHGFKIGKQKFVIGERSASMVRTQILSFNEQHVAPELSKRITMDMQIGKTVLSK